MRKRKKKKKDFPIEKVVSMGMAHAKQQYKIVQKYSKIMECVEECHHDDASYIEQIILVIL